MTPQPPWFKGDEPGPVEEPASAPASEETVEVPVDDLEPKQLRNFVKYGRRRNDGPLWYRVLDRQGLPTLLVLVVMSVFIWVLQKEREDRTWERDQRSVEHARIKDDLIHIKAMIDANGDVIRLKFTELERWCKLHDSQQR